jgi:hypothetical protein
MRYLAALVMSLSLASCSKTKENCGTKPTLPYDQSDPHNANN